MLVSVGAVPIPVLCFDFICRHLSLQDTARLRQTCLRLRQAGLGPELHWHWRLTSRQSLSLYRHPLRDKILGPATSVHTLDLWGTNVTDVSALGNVHTLDLRWTRAMLTTALDNVACLAQPNGKRRRLGLVVTQQK